jgi:hypothetical protein
MISMALPSKHPSVSKASSSRPFLRFYHSAALRKKTLALLAAVENAPDATEHRGALAELVAELTNCGMDAYFIEPLKSVKLGFIVEQSANLGMATVQQVMGSVIRQVIGRMDSAQLHSVCGSIRKFML